jgi:hypothetical protein
LNLKLDNILQTKAQRSSSETLLKQSAPDANRSAARVDEAKIFPELTSHLLAEGHTVRFSAPGDSMYPTICDGDIITVAPVKTACVTTGDIILYRHQSGVTVHRVIRIATKKPYQNQHTPLKPQPSVLGPQTYLILRGDAAVVVDDPVLCKQVLGRVTFVERQGRRIDPYSLKTTICFKARRMAAYLKRFLRSKT